MTAALVLGGGPAGAAAALCLARAGLPVTLVEREAAPREKVCGEFLGANAARRLRTLGIDLSALGAVPIGGARLAVGARMAAIGLPFAAWGLPRAKLDEALLTAARDAGACILRGHAARRAERVVGGWRVHLSDSVVLTAPVLVLATGKHELRGQPRAWRGHHVGLKLPLRLSGPLAEVLLLPLRGGYAGLQPSADGRANLCLALRAADGRVGEPYNLLAKVAAGSDLAAALLADAVPLWKRPLAVGGLPYGFLHRDVGRADPALFRVGDQFAVIPSLAGEGMDMALASGIAAAAAISAAVPAPDFHADLARAWRRPMRWAGLAAGLLHRAPNGFVWAAGLLPGSARSMVARMRLQA
ncbi:NAD(P)/FAD-dependent oxidoreductase [Pseudoroseomonas globiformis]|uniref:NAD(P)/FAD-dependent oxidoreductase n=1 Tax=Teichococcus globiformis TaxID=2307229 RepID=A0ABV7G403_9PROT